MPSVQQDTSADGPGVIDISAGSSHSVALIDNSTVITAGRGEDGQLGHGTSDELTEFKAVYTLLDKAISNVQCGAEYSIAVSQQNKTIYSWGWGDFGRLGHGDSADAFLPKPISFFQGMVVKHVACGDTHTLVVTDTGELFSFGRNQNGQLGLGHIEDMLSPQLVEALQGHQVVGVAAGAEHTLAVTSQGEVYGWGWGRYGNIGDGFQQDRHLPTRVIGLEGCQIVEVRCGWRHSVALSSSGKLYTWGWSKYGQLGHSDNEDRVVPTLVEDFHDRVITCVAGGWRHTVAADSQGTLYSWGWNRFGQLGLGDIEDRNSPTPVPKLTGVGIVKLACGWRHTLAITKHGQLYTWGRGTNGQLGHADTDDKNEPTMLVELSRGSLDAAAIRATASPIGGYVSPEDRYAVVPGGVADGNGNGYGDDSIHMIVPDMNSVPASQGPVKKPRVADT